MSCEFFAGANTSSGYASGLVELVDQKIFRQVFLLQGCPGNGKSTLLKKIAARAQKEGSLTEVIRCSFDPDSIDGVVVGDISILDATFPHEISPRYIAAVETPVDLSHACSHKKLAAHRHQIIRLIGEKKELYSQSSRYLYGASALLSDIARTLSPSVDEGKITKLARRIARDNFPTKHKTAHNKTRFLSAHTAVGEVYLWNTVLKLANNIVLIEDEFELIAHPLLTQLRELANKNGLDTISCRNPLYAHNQLQHLFIPELSLAYICVPKRSLFPFEPARIINCRRFIPRDVIVKHKHSIRLQKKAATQMLTQSALMLLEMRVLHTELEQLYLAAIDFAEVDRVSEALLTEIF